MDVVYSRGGRTTLKRKYPHVDASARMFMEVWKAINHPATIASLDQASCANFNDLRRPCPKSWSVKKFPLVPTLLSGFEKYHKTVKTSTSGGLGSFFGGLGFWG